MMSIDALLEEVEARNRALDVLTKTQSTIILQDGRGVQVTIVIYPTFAELTITAGAPYDMCRAPDEVRAAERCAIMLERAR